MEALKTIVDGFGHKDLNLLKQMKSFMEDKIASVIKDIAATSKLVKPEEYITYDDAFLTDCDTNLGIIGDLESLGLHTRTSKSVSTAWLTLNDQSYSWMSSQGPVTSKSRSLDSNNTSFIKEIMDKINSEKGLKLNSCLVSYYPSENATLKLHADDEP